MDLKKALILILVAGQLSLFADNSEVALVDFDFNETPYSEDEDSSSKGDDIDFKFSFKDEADEPEEEIIDPHNDHIAFAEDRKFIPAVVALNEGVIKIQEAHDYYQTRTAFQEDAGDDNEEIAFAGELETKNPGNVAEDPLLTYPRAKMLQLFDGSGNEFFIDRFTVTNKQYQKFIQATDYTPPKSWENGKYAAGEDDQPVTDVSYKDALAYSMWESKRLPTENEWISAYRTGLMQFNPVKKVKEWTSTVGNDKETKLVMDGTNGSDAPVSKDSAAPDIGFRTAADPEGY